MKRFHQNTHHGFSLVEIAVVLFIVTLIIGGITAGQMGLIGSGKTLDVMTLASDLPAIMRDFKQRYHFLPGDFPINAASPEIPNVSAACIIGGAGAGNGNGLIEAAPLTPGDESRCLPDHLFNAGYIKGGTGSIKTSYGAVSVLGNRFSNVFAGTNPLPATILNVIEFANLPCDVAKDIDRRLDDDNIATGNIRASVATCRSVNDPAPLNDPVPFVAISIN